MFKYVVRVYQDAELTYVSVLCKWWSMNNCVVYCILSDRLSQTLC